MPDQLYEGWEGIHLTPSEVSTTQHTHRVVKIDGLSPPRKLSAEYIAEHTGYKDGPPDEHREVFPMDEWDLAPVLQSPNMGLNYWLRQLTLLLKTT